MQKEIENIGLNVWISVNLIRLVGLKIFFFRAKFYLRRNCSWYLICTWILNLTWDVSRFLETPALMTGLQAEQDYCLNIRSLREAKLTLVTVTSSQFCFDSSSLVIHPTRPSCAPAEKSFYFSSNLSNWLAVYFQMRQHLLTELKKTRPDFPRVAKDWFFEVLMLIH